MLELMKGSCQDLNSNMMLFFNFFLQEPETILALLTQQLENEILLMEQISFIQDISFINGWWFWSRTKDKTSQQGLCKDRRLLTGANEEAAAY